VSAPGIRKTINEFLVLSARIFERQLADILFGKSRTYETVGSSQKYA
jgi:hypothetical protein